MARPKKTYPTIDPSLTGSGFETNPALARCAKAWHRTYELATIAPGDGRLAPPDDDSTLFANSQAAIAFRDAMPPLSGQQNISDFIACVTFAMMKSLFRTDESLHLLSAAKIAISALRAQPRPSKNEFLFSNPAPDPVQNRPSKNADPLK